MYGDLNDSSSLNTILRQIEPDEIYNLGAQSHVRVSFDVPEYTVSTIAMGTLRLLEGMRELGGACRFYQASSSEMFGAAAPPQDESTPFLPQSPYACAKAGLRYEPRGSRVNAGRDVPSGSSTTRKASQGTPASTAARAAG